MFSPSLEIVEFGKSPFGSDWLRTYWWLAWGRLGPGVWPSPASAVPRLGYWSSPVCQWFSRRIRGRSLAPEYRNLPDGGSWHEGHRWGKRQEHTSDMRKGKAMHWPSTQILAYAQIPWTRFLVVGLPRQTQTVITTTVKVVRMCCSELKR